MAIDATTRAKVLREAKALERRRDVTARQVERLEGELGTPTDETGWGSPRQRLAQLEALLSVGGTSFDDAGDRAACHVSDTSSYPASWRGDADEMARDALAKANDWKNDPLAANAFRSLWELAQDLWNISDILVGRDTYAQPTTVARIGPDELKAALQDGLTRCKTSRERMDVVDAFSSLIGASAKDPHLRLRFDPHLEDVVQKVRQKVIQEQRDERRWLQEPKALGGTREIEPTALSGPAAEAFLAWRRGCDPAEAAPVRVFQVLVDGQRAYVFQSETEDRIVAAGLRDDQEGIRRLSWPRKNPDAVKPGDADDPGNND